MTSTVTCKNEVVFSALMQEKDIKYIHRRNSAGAEGTGLGTSLVGAPG